MARGSPRGAALIREAAREAASQGGRQPGGAFPNRDPPCSTPPPIQSHTTLTENPLPLAPTLTYI